MEFIELIPPPFPLIFHDPLPKFGELLQELSKQKTARKTIFWKNLKNTLFIKKPPAQRVGQT
tara:strand:+ start:266 stop:451 length:186 start_codon:yes stop_codon:yes gene_type:complete